MQILDVKAFEAYFTLEYLQSRCPHILSGTTNYLETHPLLTAFIKPVKKKANKKSRTSAKKKTQK
jgi:hypothetical protein